MTYRQPSDDLPITSDNTHLGHFSDDLPITYRQPTDNTPLPLKGELGVAGSPLGELPSKRAGDGLIEACPSLPEHLHETLRAWSVNTMLECSSDAELLQIAIGGAVLDLRDLERLLDWMADAFLPALTDAGLTHTTTETRREG